MADMTGEIAEIEGMMADKTSGYWRGPAAEATQARYRDLVEARDAGQSAPAQSAAGTERLKIERMMVDRKSAYWKGPEANHLQARYRDLCEGAGGDQSIPATEIVAVQEHLSSGPAGAQLVEDWSVGGRFEENLSTARARVEEILNGVSERTEFLLSFEQLPEPVQASVYRTLAEPSRQGKGATPKEIDLFKETPEGAALALEWGSNTPARVARVKARMSATIERLSQGERLALDDWLDRLPSQEYTAVLRVMAE